MASNDYYLTTVDDTSLDKVAAKTGCTPEQMRAYNSHVNDPNNVVPGTKVVVPRGAAPAAHPQQ